MPACAAVSLGLLSCGGVIGRDCRKQHAASTVLLCTNPGALLLSAMIEMRRSYACGEWGQTERFNWQEVVHLKLLLLTAEK